MNAASATDAADDDNDNEDDDDVFCFTVHATAGGCAHRSSRHQRIDGCLERSGLSVVWSL